MRIGDNLGENDEIYLDITHAFRSIPLFMYLMLDLIRILKLKNNFKLVGLFYGMLEAGRDLGYAPIVDLSPLYNLTSWAKGAYNFINFGNGYLLADLINYGPMADKVRNISDLISINYIKDFKREIDSLGNDLDTIESSDPVVKYMKPYLKSFTTRFKGISSSSKLQLELAKWYFENNRFSHGYICLAESIISRLLEIYRERDKRISWNESSRRKIKDLIYKAEFKQKADYCKISEVYNSIRGIRNNIAHAGFSARLNFKENIDQASIYINNVERYVFNNRALEKIPDEYPFEELYS